VVLESGRPIFFRQRRIGANGREFTILKFRTMTSEAEKLGETTREALGEGSISLDLAVQELKGQGALAVTRVGGFLRRTSLDELPQLINVLRGDMSLVGPRPLQEYEVAELDRWELYRHEMRPGITGMWQVFGRSDINWDERMQLDYTYVRHWSPLLDLRILFDTLPAILRGRGAV
jgi:lipopolysaccharide/colanic/teichoic acid biosynthesis glycosyltransferase